MLIDKLIAENNKIIEETNDKDKKEKHMLIKKILEDRECFLKMDIETSYALLRELDVPEIALKEVYLELIEK